MSRGDLTRDRKVKVAVCAMIALFAGLLASLITLHYAPASGGTIAGLYAPFGIGIGTVVGLFSSANVKVHQATSGQGAQP